MKLLSKWIVMMTQQYTKTERNTIVSHALLRVANDFNSLFVEAKPKSIVP